MFNTLMHERKGRYLADDILSVLFVSQSFIY